MFAANLVVKFVWGGWALPRNYFCSDYACSLLFKLQRGAKS